MVHAAPSRQGVGDYEIPESGGTCKSCILCVVAAPPRFTAQDRPRDILDAAGRWLAAELGDGFQWVPSAHALKLPVGGTSCELVLQPSHWNYTGVLTHASIRVMVRDKALARWRRRQGRSQAKIADVVWRCEMINIDRDLHEVELFGDVAGQTSSDVRFLTLPELLEGIRIKILPKFLLFESPARVAKELPDTWLIAMGSTVEWAISRGDNDSADAISARVRVLAGKAPPRTELDAVIRDGRTLRAFAQSELVHFREYRDAHMSDEPLGEAIDLIGRWLAELSDYAGQSKHVADTALRDLVTRQWPADSKFAPEAIAFETAASRMRTEQTSGQIRQAADPETPL